MATVMSSRFLHGARLLEVTERSPAHQSTESAYAPQDTRPRLVFDTGVLDIENPFQLSCDSAGRVNWAAIIGCCVSDAIATDTDWFLVFEARISLRISLREEDFIGPAAASFRADRGETIHVK